MRVHGARRNFGQSMEADVKTLLRSRAAQVLFLAPFMALAGSGFAADYQDEWGPPVGSAMPAIDAPDQAGAARTLGDLAGERGVLLFVNRSADW